jgi:23S rRNA (uracil1939-C5)-methyltransferase
MSERTYAHWKHEIVAEAFSHRGIEAEIKPLRRVEAGSRRRAQLGVARKGDAVLLGFREEGRHRLVDLEECPILDPAIVKAFAPLRQMARLLLRDAEGGRLLVTRLDHGLDVAFEAGTTDLAPEVMGTLAHQAAAVGIARLTVDGEIIALNARPSLSLSGIAVESPHGAFLQAVPEAEEILTMLVLEAMPRAKRVADLFSGLGTFTFALARKSTVLALDSDRRAIAALTDAARRAQGLRPIEARVRDLFREPLSARELESFDAVVFDPPRAGAAAQAERIAKSKVPVVVAVSCNPATLARDARILIDGGYRLGPVTPVDQFVFTPHIEAVAVFRR